ncbi:MAG: nickel-dependent hydrogenase large subunit [Firmicutes bacterium]|nr:nickel-dependent hydrogenase large subunit [Bacillota bacterium]
MTKISFSPVTRLSGLMSIDLYLDAAGKVTEANIIGEQFRGFEAMLRGRNISDAVYFCQRICGICSMAHGFIAARLVDQIYGIEPTPEIILLQQAMLGAEFLQNHIRHFYLLALPDYLNSENLPESIMRPGTNAESRFSEKQQRLLVEHYFAAMEASRKCHDMLAVFGGKIPHQHGLVSEGVAVYPNADRRIQFLSLLTQAREFIEAVMLPDVYLLAEVYADYLQIGAGPYRYLSYGLFDPRFGGHFPAGIVNEDQWMAVNPAEIRESITFAWYEQVDSEIRPAPEKPGAYTWVKAPRYRGLAYEGGPLARKIIRSGPSGGRFPATGTMARLVARVEEAAFISGWIADWFKELPAAGEYIIPLKKPVINQAVQTGDAPRGPLLHAMAVAGEEITSYNVITPSNWNFSPKDETGQRGAAEASLLGAQVDLPSPMEPGRIIRSFDPCLNCATHFIDWEGKNMMSLNISV